MLSRVASERDECLVMKYFHTLSSSSCLDQIKNEPEDLEITETIW